MKTETKVKRCMIFDYDKLVAMMDIDLLRDKTMDAPTEPDETPF